MPLLRPQYFPKRLFFRFVFRQVFGVLPTTLIAIVLVRIYLRNNVASWAEAQDFLPLLDHSLLLLAFLLTLLVIGTALLTGYRLVLPLGRVLMKARSIQRRDYNVRLEEPGEEQEEPSEWSDLESTLHKIGRDIQSKDKNLTRERQQVETVMSALTEAVAAIDKTGTMLFFNTRFALLFGRGKRDARLSEFVRTPDVLEAFHETLKDGQARQISTKLRLKGESSSRHFSLSLAPLRHDNESLYGAIGVFHDVTEIRRMDQVRVDFVANVSHELRSPLTSIKGYAQTLKMDTPADHPSRKFLDTIERNTDRLIALTHDLLNLSALDSGVELERQEIKLQEFTHRVLTPLENQRLAKQHELSVIVNVPTLLADPKRIEQVLVNLVENSIKYMPAGGKIWVEWSPVPEGVQLRVFDNGPGIQPEHHSRVFERFYRVDSSRARDQGGTGLGLAIVKHIIQSHGGRVETRTNPAGRGADFVCIFPTPRET